MFPHAIRPSWKVLSALFERMIWVAAPIANSPNNLCNVPEDLGVQ
jgi:hypothetical protein